MKIDVPFDEDQAHALLDVEFAPHAAPLRKALYNFDLDTPDGVRRLVELLPVLDEEIVKEVYSEVFTGYPTSNIAPRLARAELRGYLMDYLDGNDPSSRPVDPSPGDEA